MSATIPPGFELVRTTPEFTDETAPPGLRRAHRVADGVWGRLCLRAGTARFVFERGDDGPTDESVHELGQGDAIVIPPGRPHHVEPCRGARFVVEFYATPVTADVAEHDPSGIGLPDRERP